VRVPPIERGTSFGDLTLGAGRAAEIALAAILAIRILRPHGLVGD
jgi:hypothetical protein